MKQFHVDKSTGVVPTDRNLVVRLVDRLRALRAERDELAAGRGEVHSVLVDAHDSLCAERDSLRDRVTALAQAVADRGRKLAELTDENDELRRQIACAPGRLDTCMSECGHHAACRHSDENGHGPQASPLGHETATQRRSEAVQGLTGGGWAAWAAALPTRRAR